MSCSVFLSFVFLRCLVHQYVHLDICTSLCKVCYSLLFLCLASVVGKFFVFWKFFVFFEEVREKLFNSILKERELSLSCITEYFESKILNEELGIRLFFVRNVQVQCLVKSVIYKMVTKRLCFLLCFHYITSPRIWARGSKGKEYVC